MTMRNKKDLVGTSPLCTSTRLKYCRPPARLIWSYFRGKTASSTNRPWVSSCSWYRNRSERPSTVYLHANSWPQSRHGNLGNWIWWVEHSRLDIALTASSTKIHLVASTWNRSQCNSTPIVGNIHPLAAISLMIKSSYELSLRNWRCRRRVELL